MRPGQDIVIVGHIGAEGTVKAALENRELLLKTLPREFVDRAAALEWRQGLAEELRGQFPGSFVREAGEGGIFAALWNMAEACNAGFTVDMKKLPILQETIEVCEALDQLDLQRTPYKILFLDASDEVLCRRYKETRRRHPISQAEDIPTVEALAKEREILRPLLDRADYVIDTSLLSTAQNKERICDLFLPGGGAKAAMRLTVMSFGFKFGLPGEADLVLDVRCLPNPFYVPQLKHKTGLDQEVADYVMSFEASRELLARIEYLLDYALPLYVREGKSELTIAVGCTGGKHRSITFARKIADYCQKLGYATSTQHRDAAR